jgi:hypothetical protein
MADRINCRKERGSTSSPQAPYAKKDFGFVGAGFKPALSVLGDWKKGRSMLRPYIESLPHRLWGL